MNWPILAPVILAVVTGILGFLSGLYLNRWHKQIDRRTELLRERRVAYRDFASASEVCVMRLLGDAPEIDLVELTIKLRSTYANLRLVASDDVLHAVFIFRGALSVIESSEEHKEEEIKNCADALNSLYDEMRKDTFVFNVVPLPTTKGYRTFIDRAKK